MLRLLGKSLRICTPSDNIGTDVVVIGGGSVGLACARAFGRKRREVILLESEVHTGKGISSRSSEVIHAGIYYSTGSAKARLCVDGRDKLFDFVRGRGIPYSLCGKLVVARPSEVETLDRLYHLARSNGVPIRRITGREARVMEPELSSEISDALVSPNTAVFDSHAYCTALAVDVDDSGGSIARNVVAISIVAMPDGRLAVLTAPTPPRDECIYVEAPDGAQGAASPFAAALFPSMYAGRASRSRLSLGALPPRLYRGPAALHPTARVVPVDAAVVECNMVVNAAGLHAPLLACRTLDLTQPPSPHLRGALGARTVGLCRGSYYTVRGRAPFGRLVYPIPTTASLGLHYTIDVGGGCRFGPDVHWLCSSDGGRSVHGGGAATAGVPPPKWHALDAHLSEFLCCDGEALEAIYETSDVTDRRLRVVRGYAPVPANAYAVPTEPLALSRDGAEHDRDIVDSIARYWQHCESALADAPITPTYAGVRPKLCAAGAPGGDFEVVWSGGHAVCTLLGVESPGLTASLAIADRVACLQAL